jgi:AcrR family transcriptional regulator
VAIGTKRSRQRREPDTLDKIMLAARDEFSEQGLSGAQLNKIARQAGVTKQVVYYYYGSKEGLYEAVLKRTAEECLTELLAVDFLSLEPRLAVRQIFGMFFDFFLQRPFLVPLTLDVNFHGSVHVRSKQKLRQVFDLFGKIADRGIAEGVFPVGLDKAASFSFAMQLVSGSFLQRYRLWTGEDGGEGGAWASVWRAKVLDAIEAIMTVRTDPTLGP